MFNYYNNLEKINAQIGELERLKQQIQQPVPITQNFQLAPNNFMRYAKSIDDVNKTPVVGDTPFFSQDMTVMWLKKATGETKTYELKEIVEKDEKDLQIELLMAKIKEMEENAKSNDDDVNESTKSKKSSNVSNDRKSKTESE